MDSGTLYIRPASSRDHERRKCNDRVWGKILEKHGLFHNDLHNLNAIIGSNDRHKPVVKLIDVGGLSEINKLSHTTVTE